MKNIIIPDYKHSIMNITTSILKHYNVKTEFSTLDVIDKELKKNYRNIVVFLVDAMGSEILQKHKKESEYLIQNQVDILTSVFPPTTVAATTSILTGRPPINTGWIGWLQYIKEEDKSVIFFYNKDFYDETVEFDYNISEKFAPVKKIYQLIEEQNDDVSTAEIFPEFRVPEHKTFKDVCNTIIKETQKEGKHFIYAYWDKLDTYLHRTGTESDTVKEHMKEINEDIKYLIDELDDDTLVIVTADHGQLDIEEIELWEYQDIIDMFRHNPSIEARATAFFIKEDKHAEFMTLFNRYFGENFILYKSEDFLASKLLGEAKEQDKVKEFLGDFISVAVDKYSFKLSNSKREFKAQHAGLTKEEVLVPLIMFSPKK